MTIVRTKKEEPTLHRWLIGKKKHGLSAKLNKRDMPKLESGYSAQRFRLLRLRLPGALLLQESSTITGKVIARHEEAVSKAGTTLRRRLPQINLRHASQSLLVSSLTQTKDHDLWP